MIHPHRNSFREALLALRCEPRMHHRMQQRTRRRKAVPQGGTVVRVGHNFFFETEDVLFGLLPGAQRLLVAVQIVLIVSINPWSSTRRDSFQGMT